MNKTINAHWTVIVHLTAKRIRKVETVFGVWSISKKLNIMKRSRVQMSYGNV